MNKQALAFLTMFSLILMLSVYYVTLPSDTTTASKEETPKQSDSNKKAAADEKSDEQKDKEEDAKEEEGKETTSQKGKAQLLQDAIEQKKEAEINKQSEVIANKDSKKEDKQTALSTMDTLKSEQKLQGELVVALQKIGYKGAVEIQNGTCIISIFDQKEDAALVKKVMQKVSELTNNKYLIEVAFK